jgi:hypothetical protein
VAFTEQGGGKIVKRVARMSTDREGVANNPGYCDTPDEVTKSYFVQQTVNTIYHLPNFVVSNGGGREGGRGFMFLRPFNKELKGTKRKHKVCTMQCLKTELEIASCSLRQGLIHYPLGVYHGYNALGSVGCNKARKGSM